VQDDIPRLDITMNNPLLVGVIQCGCEGKQQARNLHWLQPFVAFVQFAQEHREGGSHQVFHHDIGMSLDGVVIVDLNDIGMTQARYDLRFALKTGLKLRVRLYKLLHHLDGDRAVQSEMRAKIHLCHAAPGDLPLDAYLADSLSDPLWHERIIQQPFKPL
jgi:hypothetical protein